jgi:hypothetical protein
VPKYDPRLADPMILLLAGRRLQHRLSHPLPDWDKQEGLCAIVQQAQALGLPSRDPWDVSGLKETSFSALLREAQAWQREQEGQA